MNNKFDDRMDRRLHCLRETAQLLGGISVWTLRKSIAAGRIKPVRIGRRILIASEEIERIRREGLPSLGTARDHASQS
jgi:excisionase family DNA binding protein